MARHVRSDRLQAAATISVSVHTASHYVHSANVTADPLLDSDLTAAHSDRLTPRQHGACPTLTLCVFCVLAQYSRYNATQRLTAQYSSTDQPCSSQYPASTLHCSRFYLRCFHTVDICVSSSMVLFHLARLLAFVLLLCTLVGHL